MKPVSCSRPAEGRLDRANRTRFESRQTGTEVFARIRFSIGALPDSLPTPVPSAAANALFAHRIEFQTALLAWFRREQRTLPWRTHPSLYRTVTSEFMLQQTQVKTVLPYFDRWHRAFPDFPALAAASESDVLRQWEGLGYYSRARNLHRLAKAVVALPTIPKTVAEWQELPGVGPYTAAAVTSIAFNTPAACVDGNVVRILARLTADATAFKDSASAAKQLAPLAEALLTVATPGDHNQAMMELGATVCFRQKPLCLTCPVRIWCAGTKSGEPEAFPRLASKIIEQRAVTRIWLIENGALLLHRSAADARRFANIHELPTAEQMDLNEKTFAEAVPLARKKRGITRYAITESIYGMTKRPARIVHPELFWVPLAELEGISLSGPHRRWVNELLKTRDKTTV